MTVSAPASPAVAIPPAALEQRVAQVLRRARERHGGLPARVLLLRAAPVWAGPASFQVGEWTVQVVACVSPLAVLEQVIGHAAADDDAVLVVLTDREDGELGNGVLSQVLGQQVVTIEPWTLVLESFGAQRLDPRLLREGWAAEALVAAMPPGGWPRLSGGVLNRDVVLRHLAVRRLGLERLRVTAEDLDAQALLRWSALPGAVESFSSLRAEEREGLQAWLIELTGRAARGLFALAEVGRGSDALPLGLVCGALWAPAAQGATERSRGRVDRYFGDAHLDDDVVRAFADVAAEVIGGLLDESASSGPEAMEAGRLVHAVLDRAGELLEQLGVEDAARYSDVLRAGFEHRIGTVAAALRAWLDGADRRDAGAALALAVTALDQHRLAAIEPQRHRIDRARMALRLTRWLDLPVEEPSSVGDGIDRQIAEWGWVDRALGHVWIGEDVNAELKAGYRALYERASQRRRQLDAAFAARLAAWTSAGAAPGRMLTVESVLSRVVAPLIVSGKRPALLLVLDGMSAAVAAELAEELRQQRWDEYDPLGDTDPGRQARRRAAVAALPTITTVSRMSLFAAEPREGGQDEERKAFEGHRLWRGRKVRLFHSDAVRGPAGEVLADDLQQALADTDTLVAVVLNTIDDALDHGREGLDAGWRVADIGPLRELLDFARYNGRAVIIVSDHGHVLEHGGELRRAQEILSARHRAGDGPAGEGEIELAGDRVVAPGGRVVAL
jgi:PglZ domain